MDQKNSQERILLKFLFIKRVFDKLGTLHIYSHMYEKSDRGKKIQYLRCQQDKTYNVKITIPLMSNYNNYNVTITAPMFSKLQYL